MAKHVHGDTIEYTSDYVEGDIVKYEADNKLDMKSIEYSKIIKVKARLHNDKTLMLSYVMENGKHVELSAIKEMIKKNYSKS